MKALSNLIHLLWITVLLAMLSVPSPATTRCVMGLCYDLLGRTWATIAYDGTWPQGVGYDSGFVQLANESRNPTVGTGGLFSVFGKSLAANTAARTFSSTDPLVADLANKIEALYPGHVVGVNVPLQSALGATDADILLQNAVIQVKSGGSAQGLLLQLQKSEAATGLPSLGFGPNLPFNSLRTLSQQGGLVTGDENLLLQVVKP